ncbi:ABC transporter permease [Paenibacillus harenae]|uniref:ABC transporter permease n=1 Tax=Paenibacillus harenae TaxID=306543 RepID=UPI00279303D3|nr:ABC transporter permease [Paenibacillus harenae]MDQ0064059.1 ABC-2 type transport system permease protein [Paenibacillus harenae]
MALKETVSRLPVRLFRPKEDARSATSTSAFWVMVRKEFSDHVRSWRFVILMTIILLACIGSIYSAITALRSGNGQAGESSEFLFLQIFTLSDGTLPNFIGFVTFLGPLMGIALGFDAVNAERSKGTLSRLISQPIYRDDFLNAKFVSTLLIIAVSIFSIGLLVMGVGLIVIGFPPTPEEFWRVLLFLITAIIYVGFWLNVSILFSVRFRQATTSALAGISLWIFFSVFYGMILNLIAKGAAPATDSGAEVVMGYQKLMQALNRFSPSELFNEANTTLLMPNVRSLGPLAMEQVVGALPSPLPLGQSILLVWPHLTGMLAATMICFGLSYLLFMRQEIRSRS